MDFWQFLVALAIGAVGGLASTLVTRVVRPTADNWLEQQRDERSRVRAAAEATEKRRQENLERLADWFRRPTDGHFGMMAAAAVGDEHLTAIVGRINVAETPEARRDAQGDAATRLGELIR